MANNNTYTMLWKLQYDGQLMEMLDEIRAIPMVLTVHIEKDLGKNRELIKLKILTKYPAVKSFQAIRQIALSKISQIRGIEMQQTTLTKLF